jgi:hypothetical protein
MATASASLYTAVSSIGFDRSTGRLSILGDARNNTVQEWISDDGYLQLMLDGHAKSSDPLSAFFDSRLQGATRETITRINFDGGEGRDTLLVGNQSVNNLAIAADDDILINGNAIIASGSLDVSADTITTTGSLTGSKISLNSRDALKLESGTKIISQAGDKGGTVHLLGKEVSLTGVAIDASGVNGGGTVLIGGDYQGKGGVPNARTTFIDASTVINVDALQNGDGGRAIVWADDATEYYGNITARGGKVSGDGGFAEVSGKQDLKFRGNADLSAANGKLGDLLLDPENITISDAEETPDGTTVNAGKLQALKGNVSLLADNSIQLNTSLNFVSGSGAIKFTAGASFTGSGDINTSGRNVTITAPLISTQAINTSNDLKGGSITLTGTSGVSALSLSASGSNGIGGNITLASSAGTINAGAISTFGLSNAGKVDVSAKDSISASDINASSANGTGKDIKLISSSGSINAGVISTSGLSNAGKVEVSAKDSISLSDINASSASGTGKDVKLTSLASSIYVGLVSSAGKTKGGNITLNGLSDITNSSLSTDSVNGIGGNIKLTSTEGSVHTGGISTFSLGDAGKVDINANNTITTAEIYTNSTEGNGRDVSLTSKLEGISTRLTIGHL